MPAAGRIDGAAQPHFGELVPIEVAERQWFARGGQFRDRVLGIPARVADQTAALLAVPGHELRLIAQEVIEEALLDLSKAVRTTHPPIG
jgi:hypothetical protein